MKEDNKNNIGKNAVILTFSKMIVLFVSMIISMLLSRYLSLKDYGTYSTILLVTNIVITIFVLGLPNSINFFLSSATKEERKDFTSIYYTFSTLLCLFAGIIIVIFLPILEKYFNNFNLNIFWYVFAVLPWTKVILSSIDNFLVVFNKTKLLMIFKIINSFIILLSVIAIKLLKLSFAEYMLIYIVVEIVFSIIAIKISTMNIEKINFKFSGNTIRKILKFSIPLGLASVVGTVTIELGKIIIGGFFDSEKLAIYANASKEMPVTIIATSLTAVLMPQLVKLLKKNKNQEAVNLWKQSTTLSYVFMCFFAFFLFFNAKEVIIFLYSSKYLPGVEVFKIYTLVLLVRTTYFGMILNSTGKTKFIFYSSIVTLILNIVLSYLFYYLFGFIGPALATLISMYATAAFQLLASARSIKIKINNILEWKNILVITTANIFLGFLFNYIKEVLLKSTNINSILVFLIISATWFILYIVVFNKLLKAKWNSLKKVS